MGPDREPELAVERRIEIRKRLHVGLVEPVLELGAVGGSQPAAVYVMVYQRQVLDVLGEL